MIYTHRLIIRQLALADAPFILALLNQPSFIGNLGDKGVRTIADAEQYLQQGPLASYQQHGFGLLALQLAGSEQLIGICGLLQREQLPAPDLGYALLPQYTGQGFAEEAAKACLQLAVALNIPSLFAVVNTDNSRSIRLLEQLQFQYVEPHRLENSPPLALYQLSF
ncbi:GNAT family N-acetyltransferase [Arsukibacterium sp.]|uniref:GNAT family N-acetyltransferase n=1 Tax=Arsukibacterium sp. TaxID=1977258 RepID=UPI002FD8A1D6